MDIFKKEFSKEDKVSNWGLLTTEEQEKQENWLHLNGYYVPKLSGQELEVTLHMDEQEMRLINQELTTQYENEARIVPMRG